MKKLIIWSMFLVTFTTLFAQDFKQDVKQFILVSGGNSSIELAKDQILPMIPEKNREAFLKEFDATLPIFWDSMIKIYMEEYTHDEIKELLKFYESPIGKKMASKVQIFGKKGMEAGQVWGEGLQPIIMKYMQ